MDTPTRTRPLPIHEGPLAVNTNVSSTAFADRIRNNPKLALNLAIAVIVLIIVVVGGAVFYNSRSAAAADQLSAALQTYSAPIRTAESPVAPGTQSFASTDERAKAANAQFAAIANQYGMTAAGRNALYLQGVTALQTGQNSTAEALLKKSAASWNRDIADMASLALANLYHSTGRANEAVAEYRKVIDKPSNLVPSGLARLQLAEMYEADGKPAEAKKIYAELKDKDPKSAAAQLASEKLSPAGPQAR